jgi:hypothetical protein
VILILVVVAILSVLGLSAVGYWRYVNSVPAFTPESPVMPIPNGYQKAAKAARSLSQMLGRKEPHTWLYETPPDQAHALLASVRPALDEVRASFRLEWRAAPRLAPSTFPREHSDFRACARCFAAESALTRRQGTFGTAIMSSLDAMELGSKMVQGGGVDARRVGEACHAIGFGDVEQQIVPLLPVGALPGALARVRRIRSAWPPVSEMWGSERITMLAIMTKMFRDTGNESFADQVDGARSLAGFNGGTDRWETVHLLVTPRRVVLASLDDYFRQQIAESKKPFRQRARVPVPPDPWSRLFLSNHPGEYTWRYEFAATELAILEVALAARLYRLERGRYPAVLRDIGREVLPAVPMDQWDQPVTYCLRRGKLVIYRLGPDGKDDGGLAANVRHLGTGARGDLVFGKLNWSAWRD